MPALPESEARPPASNQLVIATTAVNPSNLIAVFAIRTAWRTGNIRKKCDESTEKTIATDAIFPAAHPFCFFRASRADSPPDFIWHAACQPKGSRRPALNPKRLDLF